MSGKRGLNGDLRRFQIADLAHHDDDGIVAQEGTQGGSEAEADLGLYLGLIDAGYAVFDRILDREDLAIGRVEDRERSIKSRRLAASRRTGDQKDAVRLAKGFEV